MVKQMMVGQWSPNKNGHPLNTKLGVSLHGEMPGASLHGEKPVKVWEGGKAGSMLDMTLLDEDWFKANTHPGGTTRTTPGAIIIRWKQITLSDGRV